MTCCASVRSRATASSTRRGWNPDPIIRTVCAFANDIENLGGGYVVIGQDCDANGQPVFPPVGLLDILSFPGPDRSIRLEDFQAGRIVSRRYRNRRIGEFLKELDLTEGRSTGIPKILKVMAANGSPAPLFESDEDRLSFVIRLPCHPLARPVPPKVTGEVAPEVTPEVAPEVVRVVLALQEELSRTGLQQALDLKDEKHFRKAYLLPALASGLVEMTRPETPRSSKQRYRRTRLGQRWLETHQGNSAC